MSYVASAAYYLTLQALKLRLSLLAHRELPEIPNELIYRDLVLQLKYVRVQLYLAVLGGSALRVHRGADVSKLYTCLGTLIERLIR